jgi:hypothetical protein
LDKWLLFLLLLLSGKTGCMHSLNTLPTYCVCLDGLHICWCTFISNKPGESIGKLKYKFSGKLNHPFQAIS